MAELADTLTPTEDDRLNQAEGAVRAYCRWHIAPSRIETVTIRGNGSAILTLPSLYVTGITSVTCDGTVLTSDDFWWSEAGVLTRVNAAWTEAAVVVVFTHGYADVPPEITGVVQSLAARGIANPKGFASQTSGPFSVTFSAGDFLPAELGALGRYKIPSRT